MNEHNETKDYNPSRKREIIKNILIIFLAVMLVLTFFSNTIMNKSLAEISTESAMSGKLTERVRGSGVIESNQSYEVKIDGNRTIDTIMIKTGQEVEKDDVLFTVGTEDSEELTTAQEALIALELDYQKALLGVNEDYSTENQAINNARDDLNTAIAKRNNAIANSGSEEQALYNYTSNKSELERKNSILEKLQSTIVAIDTDDYSMSAVEYTENLVSLLNKYRSAEEEYNSAYTLYSQMFTAVPEKTTDSATEETADSHDIDSLQTDLERKELARKNAQNEYETAKSTIRNNLVSQLYGVENDIETLNGYIAEYEASKNSGAGMSIEDYDADVLAKQHALEELIAQLNKTKSENELLSKTNTLEIEAKKKELDNAKEKIEKIKEKNSITEIRSKYSGVVSSINIKPGEETVPDMPIAIIDIAEEGYTVEITVDGEKARKVKKGVEAEVVNNWNGDVTAVLSEIKNDTKSGSKNRILKFSVTGDVDSGSMLDLSIPCGSGNYDTIVPKSAVHKDNNGSFVLIVNSKSSPLGNRYFAERVPVEVLASDELSSAVQGNLNAGDYVITTSSKPVNPKEQVRMKDK
ncbi:MAG: HlyD family efflux transporter periplasmic adaptor subunit [Ruminococcus sp.]|nr:HlyD family efflux transporter periplasmic adaptor subunit [Ruminococcus sp.]